MLHQIPVCVCGGGIKTCADLTDSGLKCCITILVISQPFQPELDVVGRAKLGSDVTLHLVGVFVIV